MGAATKRVLQHTFSHTVKILCAVIAAAVKTTFLNCTATQKTYWEKAPPGDDHLLKILGGLQERYQGTHGHHVVDLYLIPFWVFSESGAANITPGLAWQAC